MYACNKENMCKSRDRSQDVWTLSKHAGKLALCSHHLKTEKNGLREALRLTSPITQGERARSYAGSALVRNEQCEERTMVIPCEGGKYAGLYTGEKCRRRSRSLLSPVLYDSRSSAALGVEATTIPSGITAY